MTDSFAPMQSLANLIAADAADTGPFDWDPGAVADWPNIDFSVSATSVVAEPQAGDVCAAH